MKPLVISKNAMSKIIHLAPSDISSPKSINRIAVNTRNSIELIDINTINYFQSESNYTQIWLNNGSKLLSCKTLKRFEDRVDTSQFLRIHKSYIINVEQIARFDISQNRAEMKDGSYVPVSRARKSILMQYLKNLML